MRCASSEIIGRRFFLEGGLLLELRYDIFPSDFRKPERVRHG
jgi:hypothetical protein